MIVEARRDLRRGRAARRAAAVASSVCLIVCRVNKTQVGKQAAQATVNRSFVANAVIAPEQRPIATAAASNGRGVKLAAPSSANSKKSRSAIASATATILTQRPDSVPSTAVGPRTRAHLVPLLGAWMTSLFYQ